MYCYQPVDGITSKMSNWSHCPGNSGPILLSTIFRGDA